MSLLYLTADKVGDLSGGGLVTAQEVMALRELAGRLTLERKDARLSRVQVWSRAELHSDKPEPWKWDDIACCKEDWFVDPPRLAHIYSGTFGKTVDNLKRNGSKVVYTIAAHDRVVSRQEHEKLGMPFPYPHLTEPALWQRYIEGYRRADIIVCPSTVAARTVTDYGPDFAHKDIRIIPHGCYLPAEIKPLPQTFCVGYLGSYGADKGVRYLLEAWKKLNYQDGSLLILGGRDAASPWVKQLVRTYGGGNIQLAGWYPDVSAFYNNVSLYVQPSATEGFGIEVLEAMAHARPVLCSIAAGSADCADPSGWFPACNTDELAQKIDGMHWLHTHHLYPLKEGQLVIDSAFPTGRMDLTAIGKWNYDIAQNYTWDKIRQRYQQLWTELL